MQNETFREIGYWGSIVAAGLGLINLILCIVQGIKIYDTELQGDFDSLMIYPAEVCWGTVLYKISVVIVLLALLMMFISFMVNVDGVLKILMIICKIIQIACIMGSIVLGIIFRTTEFLGFAGLGCVIIECIALILYIIDRDHRKTIIRVFLFSIFAVGIGVVYMLFLALLLIMLFILIYKMFKEPETKDVMYDASGKMIGWIKRE